MARPQEGHKLAFSEHNAPQPEHVIMRTDCIATRGETVCQHEVGPKTAMWEITPEKSASV